MSVARYKEKIATLERKVRAAAGGALAAAYQQVIRLRSTHKQLTAENESLLRRVAALELMAQHQDAIYCVLQRATGAQKLTPSYDPGDSSNWPLLSTLRSLKLSQYAHLQHSSIQDVASMWLKHLQQLALLLRWFQHSPEQALPVLSTAVGKALNFLKAMFLLAPQLAYQLTGVNLMTGQHDPPSKEHWRSCLEACNGTAEQITLAQDILAEVTPKLEALEQERQQVASTFKNNIQPLAACSGPQPPSQGSKQTAGPVARLKSGSGGQLTLPAPNAQSSSSSRSQITSSFLGNSQSSNAVDALKPPEGASATAGHLLLSDISSGSAAAATAGGSGATVASNSMGGGGDVKHIKASKQPASSQQLQQLHAPEPGTAVGGVHRVGDGSVEAPQLEPTAAEAGKITSAATAQAVPAAQFKQAPPFASAGSWAGTLSAFDSPDMPALDRDMLNELHKKWMQWRILVQMRAAVTYLLQEDQLARLMLGAFPFIPVVGVMFDTIPQGPPST